MARKLGLENTASYVVPEQAPDWSSGRYLNYAGRTVKYQDIVNMTNMDVARNSTMVGLSRLGPALMAVPHPATKMIGGFATVAGMAYDGLKLFSRMHSEKDNNAFWAEYNEALKEVGSQGPVQRAVTDFAIGANFVSGQSLPAELAPIGKGAAVLGSFANFAAVGVLGTAGFIGGSAISMGMNDAHTRIGMGEELGSAVRSGFSRGIAAGATGALFLGILPRYTRLLGGKMVDNEIALGFMSTPLRKQAVTRSVSAALGGGEFAGWAIADHIMNNQMRSYLGLKPTEEELSPGAIAGMVALGGFFNGALKSKTLEYLLEKAAGKKSAIQTVQETLGTRAPITVTDAELNRMVSEENFVRNSFIALMKKGAQEGTGILNLNRMNKGIEQRVLEGAGVPKKLTTPEQVEKLGGAEAVLRNTLSDDLAVARALEEISTANRLVSQAKEYELSSQAFATERTGASKVTDTFIPDAEGVAKKVRTLDYVQRYEEKGVSYTSVDKPHGLYTSPLNISSPHSDLGGKQRILKRNKNANILELEPHDYNEYMKNKIDGIRGKSPGVYAAEKFLGEKEIRRMAKENKNDLIDELSKKYPKVDWKRYYDKQEMIEGVGGIEARERGYDGIFQYDKGDPEMTEFVGLTAKAFEKDSAKMYGKEPFIPEHIRKYVSIGSAAIVSGLIYTNLGNDQWDIAETQWLTPPQSQKVAELARNEYRISRNRQDALNKAMNSLSDTYALNPDNYKMVYDRFMKLTGGYA